MFRGCDRAEILEITVRRTDVPISADPSSKSVYLPRGNRGNKTLLGLDSLNIYASRLSFLSLFFYLPSRKDTLSEQWKEGKEKKEKKRKNRLRTVRNRRHFSFESWDCCLSVSCLFHTFSLFSRECSFFFFLDTILHHTLRYNSPNFIVVTLEI